MNTLHRTQELQDLSDKLIHDVDQQLLRAENLGKRSDALLSEVSRW